MYYLLFPTFEKRTEFIGFMKAHEVSPVFHYIPLHSAPAGIKFGRTPAPMPVTDRIGDTLVRLPLFYGLEKAEFDTVTSVVAKYFAAK